MNCPAGCNEALVMAERSDVEIDYCPRCRGVWLDRGELDKIIERNASTAPLATVPRRDLEAPRQRHDDIRYGGDRDDGRGRKSKRGGFLGDLFDF